MANPNFTTHKFPLNNGNAIPAIGLGTWQSKENDTREAVKHALQHGYRHIDTALNYSNEKEVGEGIHASGVPRDQIWVTTKLDNHWHHRVRDGLESSLNDLGLDYVDLFLIHFPCSTDPDDRSKHLADWDFIRTWQEMQKLLHTRKVKNIGVSNFQITHLEKLLNHPSCEVVPAINQIEVLHFIPTIPHPVVLKLAENKGKTAAQILLMWGLQRGTSTIPKSVTLSRIDSNFELDGWGLTEQEFQSLNDITTRAKVVGDGWMPIRVFLGDDE
ncbi:hypothetical protein N7510_003455 [Penicillium lagena]|uniref:uncharacterized protein n=1 Tax=Penicillium lagena TaxID=94218 RepID=UPI0025425D27|nr:uncharacterized protein N7510_003455 [Penicillium lagena]KAJ5619471.1 hypothetical protein N7510_003455 [Penicillium lagena]